MPSQTYPGRSFLVNTAVLQTKYMQSPMATLLQKGLIYICSTWKPNYNIFYLDG